MLCALCLCTSCLRSAATSQFTTRYSPFTIAHVHRCTWLGATHPCGSHPASHASGALTAEEWTRQSIRFLVAFLAVSPAFDACSCCFRFCCFTLLLHSFLRSPLLPASLAAPQPGKYGSLALGSSVSLVVFGQVASLHSQLLSVTFLLAPSHFRNSPLTTRRFSTFPLERR